MNPTQPSPFRDRQRSNPIPAARDQTLINPERRDEAEAIFAGYAQKHRILDRIAVALPMLFFVALFGALWSAANGLPPWVGYTFAVVGVIAATQLFPDVSFLFRRDKKLRDDLSRSLTDHSLFRPVDLLDGFYVCRHSSDEARWEAAGLALELHSLQQLLQQISPYDELAPHREQEKLDATHRTTELRSAIAALLDPPDSPAHTRFGALPAEGRTDA